MPPPSHPTPKTLHAKLRAAQQALHAGRLSAVDYDRHIVSDMAELGLDESRYYALLPRLVKAALDVGATLSYAGARPPVRSGKHQSIKNLELWAFKVRLPEYPFPVYFKFALKAHPKTGESYYCHVNCHPDRC